MALAWAMPLEAQGPVPSLPAQGAPKANETVVNLMQPIQNIISGPSWLMARGIDPRPWLDRPGWDPLTRLSWSKLEGALPGQASSSSQAASLGVLVPYRSPAPAFSRSLLVTRDFSDRPLQTEPSIAVDPRDPDHLVLGTIDYNFPNNSSYVSIDGGVTWEGPFQVKYLREDRISGGDPVVKFDSQGNVYFASISIGVKEYTIGPLVGFAMVSSIELSTSKDGGFTWGEPISTVRSEIVTDARVDRSGQVRGKVYLGFLDKPWMTIGPHPTVEGQEVIYVTYIEFNVKYDILYIGELPVLGMPEVETTPRVVHSLDGGRTWSKPVAAGPTVRRVYGEVPEPAEPTMAVGSKRTVQGPQLAVTPDGALYVFWLDSTDDETMKGVAELYMARSDDAGETFAEPVRIATLLEPGFRPRNAFFRYWASAFPQVAAGPEEELYVVYMALPPDKPTDEGDIYFIRSLDGGKRWSRPQRLNQDDGDSLQFFPAIDIGPDGVLHIMWGDMRDDPVGTRYHIYYTRSADKGDTWGFKLPELDLWVGDTRVTDFPSNPNNGFTYGLFIGDYFSIAATKDDAYLAWADTRLGEYGPTNQKIGFARQRPIPAPALFISPAAGPGGESITAQGHNFQPDMDVYLRVGGNVVAAGRTDSQGRISMQVFIPISGEGAHEVQLLDSSGNVAATSFYMEFGFNNVREVAAGQQQVQEQLQTIGEQLAALPKETPAVVAPETLADMQQQLKRLDDLELQLQEIRQLLTQTQTTASTAPAGATPAPASSRRSSDVTLALIGVVGVVLGILGSIAWSAYRQPK